MTDWLTRPVPLWVVVVIVILWLGWNLFTLARELRNARLHTDDIEPDTLAALRRRREMHRPPDPPPFT
jgi:hypothetical protein